MNAFEVQHLEAIRPANVVDYLRSHGWASVATDREGLAFFTTQTPRGELQTKVLLDDSFADYSVRMAELADTLSRLENRPLREVINDLMAPPGDLIRVRIASESTESGTIGINQSIALRTSLKNLLLSSAHSAINPASAYARLSQLSAVNLLEACRERQSEHGSYVASLLVPVMPPVGQLRIDEEFGRRTTRLLYSALKTAQDAAANPEVLMGSAVKGVSANFLDALATLEPDGPRSSVEVRVNWLRGAPEAGFDQTVRLSQGAFRHYRHVAKALREAAPVANTEIEGFVIAVSLERGAAQGTATIAATVEGYGESKIRVAVDTVQHQKATEAHGKGLRVRLVGTLVKANRRLELKDHSGIEVLPVSADDATT